MLTVVWNGGGGGGAGDPQAEAPSTTRESSHADCRIGGILADANHYGNVISVAGGPGRAANHGTAPIDGMRRW